MNFSIPDDLKDEFNRAFEGQNKSAIVADLLRGAVLEKRRRQKREADLDTLIETLLCQRAQDAPMSDEEIRLARQEGRP